MRVLLAAVFVIGGMWLLASLLIPMVGHGSSGHIILVGIGVGGFAVFLVLIAQVAFNWPVVKGKDWGDADKYVKELEEKGLLVSTDYQATRAFQLEEYEDEGSHYFAELADETVMYLTGQYLYDYGPIDDDPELNQPRRFPCTEFSLRSHRDEKFMVDIVCRGLVIEPEYIEPHPEEAFWKRELEDGQIITDQTYDEIKAQLITEGREAQ